MLISILVCVCLCRSVLSLSPRPSLVFFFLLSSPYRCMPTCNDTAFAQNLRLVKEIPHPSCILFPPRSLFPGTFFHFFHVPPNSSAFLPTQLSSHHPFLPAPSAAPSAQLSLSFSPPPPNSLSLSCSLRFLADRRLLFGPAMLENVMLFLCFLHSHQASSSFSQS